MRAEEYIYDIEEKAKRSIAYEHILIGSKTIPLLLVGDNGIYIFLDQEVKDTKEFESTIRSLLLYQGRSLFIFVFHDQGCTFYNNSKNEEYEIGDEVVDRIETFYENTQIPYLQLLQNNVRHDYELFQEVKRYDSSDTTYTGEISYVRTRIREKEVEKIITTVEKLSLNNEKKYKDAEGRIYVERRDTSGIFFSGEKKKYKISEQDADKVYIMTTLFGWLGLHRFKEGDYLNGILYALSCGIFGVGYLGDLLSMLVSRRSFIRVTVDTDITGKDIFYKEKIYYDTITDKRKGILGFIIASAINVVMVNTLYKAMYMGLMKVIANIVLALN